MDGPAHAQQCLHTMLCCCGKEHWPTVPKDDIADTLWSPLSLRLPRCADRGLPSPCRASASIPTVSIDLACQGSDNVNHASSSHALCRRRQHLVAQ